MSEQLVKALEAEGREWIAAGDSTAKAIGRAFNDLAARLRVPATGGKEGPQSDYDGIAPCNRCGAWPAIRWGGGYRRQEAREARCLNCNDAYIPIEKWNASAPPPPHEQAKPATTEADVRAAFDGDATQQAQAWSMVYQLCVSLGMTPQNTPADKGVDRVCNFIRGRSDEYYRIVQLLALERFDKPKMPTQPPAPAEERDMSSEHHYGSDSFPGTDEGSHYMSQERIEVKPTPTPRAAMTAEQEAALRVYANRPGIDPWWSIDRLLATLDATRAERDAALARLADAVRERDEARAIVARLPKTADGVSVIPGDTVYRIRDDGMIQSCEFWNSKPTGHLAEFRGMVHDEYQPMHTIYSTRAAAKAAAGAEGRTT